MADIKWIKITTDMFDNRKIKHLRKLPDGNNIVLIWVMLLTMAGRCNAGGMIFLTENIPYTTKMLADELDFEENTVKLALQVLEQFEMIVTDGDYFSIAGWQEHQNVEGMEKIREQNRIRQQRKRQRTKQALLGNANICEYCGKEGITIDHIVPKTKGGTDDPANVVCACLSCNMQKTDRDVDVFLNEKIATDKGFDITRILSNSKIMSFVLYDGKRFLSRDVTGHVTHSHAIEEDKERDKEEDKEKRDYRGIIDAYNGHCPSLPKVKSLSETRKKAIKARLNTYTVDDLITAFKKAEASDFLKGANGRDWVASFDWIMKDANIAKILDGNYDNKGAESNAANSGTNTNEPQRRMGTYI